MQVIRHLRISRLILMLAVVVLSGATALAQGPARETVTFPRDHRGKQIQVSGQLLLPPGTAKVPAMIIHHGSGGVTEGREFRYAKEMIAIGVAAFVIDSFKPRGIVNTVTDQDQVSEIEMTVDALTALKTLATHARIDGNRVGIVGFSKGGTVSNLSALDRYAQRVSPQGPRFALHAPFYPGCGLHHNRPKVTTTAPIYMFLGGADTYTGVEPCTEYADILRRSGANVQVKIYPDAKHGFDTDTPYTLPTGQNFSKCIQIEQPDFSWKDRKTGETTFDAQGKPNAEGRAKYRAACMTLGVTGGPNPAAKAAAMTDLKAAVSKHLLEK